MSCKFMTYDKKKGEYCFNAFCDERRFMQKVDCPFYKQGNENEAKDNILREMKGETLENQLRILFIRSVR